jgi:glycosyltransferase involved in cell wall biosynthesis
MLMQQQHKHQLSKAKKIAVVLEAAALGRSTISGAVGGVEEFIESGENGVITPTREVSSFAAALEKLVVNDDVLQEMSLVAMEKVGLKYAVQEISTNYLNFLSKVIEYDPTKYKV